MSSVKTWVKSIFSRLYESERKKFIRPYIKRKVVEGVAFDFLIGDRDGMSWYDHDCTDPWWPEMRLIKDRLIRQGDVVFDCGGHHGCTAILFSRWTGPEGKVLVFEPNSGNLNILNTNIEINNLNNVSVVDAAVGACSGSARITTKSSNSQVRLSESDDTVEVRMIGLDNYADLKPDFIKLDVEGADIEALKGARKILEALPKMMIEIHIRSYGEFGSRIEELFKLINFTKYDTWVQWNYEKDIKPWKFIGDDGGILGLDKFVHGTHIFMLPKTKPVD